MRIIKGGREREEKRRRDFKNIREYYELVDYTYENYARYVG
jgi:hypothetical protein